MAIEKPLYASDYDLAKTARIRRVCLSLATTLGDLMEDLVVVGGLVPSLLIDQTVDSDEIPAHIGTMDLDLGMSLTVFEEERYRTISQALRASGMEPDENENGNLTRQRWRMKEHPELMVDFLIEPSLPEHKGGAVFGLEKDFAAILAPGLGLAFRDKETVEISGLTIWDERASRTVSVCGPGAFVAMKALAFKGRGAGKDAYDLYYMIRNYGDGSTEKVAARLLPLLDDPSAQMAIGILRADFLAHDALGPVRVANFLSDFPEGEETKADVVGFVRKMLGVLGG